MAREERDGATRKLDFRPKLAIAHYIKGLEGVMTFGIGKLRKTLFLSEFTSKNFAN